MASFTEGAQEFKIRSTSRAGVQGPTITFNVNIDLTPPVISGMQIVSTGVDARIKADHVTLQATATSITDTLSGVAKTRYYWSHNGDVWTLGAEYDGAQLTHTFTGIDLHSDVIHVKIEAEDNAGNTSEDTRQAPVEYIGPFDYSGFIDKWSNLPKQDRGT